MRLNSAKITLLCIKLRVKWINRSWSYYVVYRAHISFDTCHNCTRFSMHHILQTLPCLIRIAAFVKILEVKLIFNFQRKIKMSLLAQNCDTLKKIRQALVEWLPELPFVIFRMVRKTILIKCAKIEGKTKVKTHYPHFSHKMWQEQNKLFIKTF